LVLVVALAALWPLTAAAATVPTGTQIPYTTAQPSPEIAAVGVHTRSIGTAQPGVPPALPTTSAQPPAASPRIADSRETGKPSVFAMIVAGLAVVAFIVERRRRAP
jgi:hypothetical protein